MIEATHSCRRAPAREAEGTAGTVARGGHSLVSSMPASAGSRADQIEMRAVESADGWIEAWPLASIATSATAKIPSPPSSTARPVLPVTAGGAVVRAASTPLTRLFPAVVPAETPR